MSKVPHKPKKVNRTSKTLKHAIKDNNYTLDMNSKLSGVFSRKAKHSLQNQITIEK